MNIRSLACLALLILPTVSQAQCCWYVPVCVSYEVRPIIAYRPELREEKVPIVVQRVNYRREETPVRTTIWKLQGFDERQPRIYYTPVPREVERYVPVWSWAPWVWCDPCTGCPFVSYYPVQTVQRVRCIEYDYRREETMVNVRVYRWVQEPYEYNQVRWIPEVARENSWTVCRTWVWVPYETTAPVPTWMPLAR